MHCHYILKNQKINTSDFVSTASLIDASEVKNNKQLKKSLKLRIFDKYVFALTLIMEVVFENGVQTSWKQVWIYPNVFLKSVNCLDIMTSTSLLVAFISTTLKDWH